MTYFFCYDIANNKRRNQISKELEKFGIRVQKSIFQSDIPAEKAKEIKTMLLEMYAEKEDNILFFPLCNACNDKAILLGNKNLLKIESFEIL